MSFFTRFVPSLQIKFLKKCSGKLIWNGVQLHMHMSWHINNKVCCVIHRFGVRDCFLCMKCDMKGEKE